MKWLLWPLVTAIFALLAQMFVTRGLILAILFTPLIIIVEGFSRSPQWIGVAIARRHLIGLLTALLPLMAFFVTLAILPLPQLVSAELVQANLLYMILGLMTGAIMRNLTGKLALAALFDRPRLATAIVLSFFWTLVIIFAASGYEAGMLATYFLGLAVGVLLQKGQRLAIERRVASLRRLSEISEEWPKREKALSSEIVAVQLLSRGRQLPSMQFRSLRRHLETCRNEGTFTKLLALISAAVYRNEGEHLEVIVESENYADPAVPGLEDAHLLLLNAISLSELGRDEEASMRLNELLATEGGGACPLARAFHSLKTAEEFLSDPFSPRVDHAPLMEIVRALSLKRQGLIRTRRLTEPNLASFLARFAQFGVPGDSSLFRDALGYAMIAAGFAEEGRILLEECIREDRSFSNGYLHLGDYFMLRSRLLFDGQPRRSDLWHAEACYAAARTIERNPSSRIRRLAEQRLRLAKQVVKGKQQPPDSGEPEQLAVSTG